eukprot:TRINITY_DN4618_c0_g1_i1.p1 TRINITY_DN4618_c0_g1~~TRINITY_DN4618_c0_g1_i1.p1  ORF type:complete len:264 (-),score=35.26 TRINITY_DN4618_c0_g1_i1:234-1025(-)
MYSTVDLVQSFSSLNLAPQEQRDNQNFPPENLNSLISSFSSVTISNDSQKINDPLDDICSKMNTMNLTNIRNERQLTQPNEDLFHELQNQFLSMNISREDQRTIPMKINIKPDVCMNTMEIRYDIEPKAIGCPLDTSIDDLQNQLKSMNINHPVAICAKMAQNELDKYNENVMNEFLHNFSSMKLGQNQFVPHPREVNNQHFSSAPVDNSPELELLKHFSMLNISNPQQISHHNDVDALYKQFALLNVTGPPFFHPSQTQNYC